MPYFQVIHGPLTLNRMPPKGTRLECRDAGRVLLLWPYAHQLLKEMYPADFSENGMMLPHHHPFGLPFTLPKDGVECAMVVGEAYPWSEVVMITCCDQQQSTSEGQFAESEQTERRKKPTYNFTSYFIGIQKDIC
jgi:hypothetical protein